MATHGPDKKPFEITEAQRERITNRGYIAGLAFVLAALVMWIASWGPALVFAGIGAGLIVSIYIVTRRHDETAQ